MRKILVTGGAGFIGSNLVLALQEKFPEAELVVVDDFRSGHFQNLEGYAGDLVAADISRLDWNRQFKDHSFDVIFHEASITDTTEHGQFLQAHDNIEGFRRLLEFAAPTRRPVVFASSAAAYGLHGARMKEDQALAPANIYAFTKVQLENLARRYNRQFPGWRLVGLRYFNVYGPREAHKKSASSMIYQLYNQIKAGQRPRVFRAGQQRRDFVYVKDVVELTMAAAGAARSAIYNCGSGQTFSFNDIIAELNRNLGTQLEPEYFENPYPFYQAHTEADLTLAQNELYYRPRYSPAKGIADYVAYLAGRTA